MPLPFGCTEICSHWGLDEVSVVKAGSPGEGRTQLRTWKPALFKPAGGAAEGSPRDCACQGGTLTVVASQRTRRAPGMGSGK